MPRKDYYKKSSSKNERSMVNRDKAHSDMQSFHQNDLSNVMQYSSPGAFILHNMKGANNYSDFVRNANVSTEGWYSTLANGIWGVKDLHNALLGHDSAEDYLKNNGLTWGDMEGYNDAKLLGRASSGVSGLAQSGASFLSNISSDLGKLYSGQTKPSSQPKVSYLDAW